MYRTGKSHNIFKIIVLIGFVAIAIYAVNILMNKTSSAYKALTNYVNDQNKTVEKTNEYIDDLDDTFDKLGIHTEYDRRKTCSFCGEKNKSNSNYCDKCGKKLIQGGE